MRYLLVVFFLTSLAYGDTLVDQAYQRELIFLKAQKESLLKLKNDLASYSLRQKQKAKVDIETKQIVLSKTQQDIQTLQEEMKEIDKNVKEGSQSQVQLEKNYLKMRDILSPIEAKLGLASPTNEDTNPITRFETGLNTAMTVVEQLSNEKWKNQAFLDQNDHLVRGQVFNVGLFAAWAKVGNEIYPLEPYNQDFLKMSPKSSGLDEISAYLFNPSFERSQIKTYKTWKESTADAIPGIVMGIIMMTVLTLFILLARA